MKQMENTKYINNGVMINPDTIAVGDKIRITYNGMLANSNAQEVYAHVGYGNANWNNVTDVKMTKTPKGFEAVLPVYKAERLNLAFKDSADHWDNNSGMNYTFDVHKSSTNE